MAEPAKSALFLDFDSLYRRLNEVRDGVGKRIAVRAAALLAEIEAGKVIAQKGTAGRRKLVLRRCYADPRVLGNARSQFVAAGFEIVECPLQQGRDRTAAPVQMTLDALQATEAAGAATDVVLLSAEIDFGPLLQRFKAKGRTAVVYATDATLASARSTADGVIPERALVALIEAEAVPTPPAREAPVRARPADLAAVPPDRAEIEALARKVSAATNVPLLSPKAFAELFHHIADEVAEEGYHFQKTAENVTAKLTAAGRKVNRRQVVFVVRGLALKGHVFSTTDTSERLAEVFRDQVLYLISNAEVALDAREQALLPFWISGRSGQAPAQRSAAPPQPVSPAVAAALAITQPVPMEAPSARSAEPAKTARRKPAKALPVREPAPPAPPPAKPPIDIDELVAEWTLEAEEEEEEEAEVVAEAVPEPEPEPPPPPPPPPKPVSPSRRLEEIRAAAAARLAAIGKGAPAAPAAQPAPPAPAARARPAPSAPARPAPEARPSARPATVAPSAEPNKEEIESSILAAIAQAVDVLVEDGAAAPPAKAEAPVAPAPSPPPPAPAARSAPPEPEPAGDEDSGDIGDEIQKIIASYSRARQGDSR